MQVKHGQLIGFQIFLLVAASCSASSHSPAAGSGTYSVSPTAIAQEQPTELLSSFDPGFHRLRPGEMILAADEDAIPAIFAQEELFLDVESGSAEWADDELVIGVEFNGDARAYPVRLMSLHEIVNDTVGGRPVAVTWCPLCFSALVFDRRLDRELTFGVSGYLFKNNLVMYDHQTNTFWSQLMAQAIRGPMRGERLQVLPARIISWGNWKAAHPDTLVLSAKKVGYSEGVVVDPYSGYYVSETPGLTGESQDNRLASKALVVGLVVGEHARAYPLQYILGEGVINDTLGGVPVALVADREAQSASIFLRDTDQGRLEFTVSAGHEGLLDNQTGSSWDPQAGLALSGELRGTRLRRLAAPLVFWFAWAGIYPETDVFRTPDQTP